MHAAHLDWDDLRLFLAVARAGTLTAAAPRLGVSQPTAGRRLRALEARCGTALFQRSAAGLRLTDEGEAILLHAERMEEEALALERRLTGGDRGLEGQLRLSSSEWFGRLVLAPRLAAFALAHPLVTLELVADSRHVDLGRREADLGFRFVRFEAREIVQRHFTHVRYDLFASRAYLERHGAPAASGDGEGHRLITMDSALERIPDVDWLRRRFPRARRSVRSNSRDVQAEACAGGAGLAVLPRVLGAGAGLVRLRERTPPPGRDLWLGYHGDLKRLARLRALVDHLAAGVGSMI